MKIKPSIILNIILVSFLLTAMLWDTSTSTEYDPWKDLNDDGRIDMKDIYSLILSYGTEGTPINKTALRLEFEACNQSRVEITVLFNDYSPVNLAFVRVANNSHRYPIGWTNIFGKIKVCGVVPQGYYVAEAYYPDSETLFANAPMRVDENGTGSRTLRGGY